MENPAPIPATLALQTQAMLTEDQVALIKRTICPPDTTDDELELFKHQCNRTGLDPFSRQIYMIKRWNSQKKGYVAQTQTSIDGFRLIAQRSGEYEGQTAPQWCGEDGVWREVWTPGHGELYAARVGVYRKGFREPCYGVAIVGSYAVTDKDGKMSPMWKKLLETMIAKCAEALALRKAFPQELSGLYTTEEMQQAGGEAEDAKLAEERAKKSKAVVIPGAQSAHDGLPMPKPLTPAPPPRPVQEAEVVEPPKEDEEPDEIPGLPTPEPKAQEPAAADPREVKTLRGTKLGTLTKEQLQYLVDNEKDYLVQANKKGLALDAALVITAAKQLLAK